MEKNVEAQRPEKQRLKSASMNWTFKHEINTALEP